MYLGSLAQSWEYEHGSLSLIYAIYYNNYLQHISKKEDANHIRRKLMYLEHDAGGRSSNT